MDKIRIRFDPTDNSLRVMFDDPESMSYLSPIEEDTSGDFHFIKNESGQVIGFEAMFYHLRPGSVAVELETAPLIADSILGKAGS